MVDPEEEEPPEEEEESEVAPAPAATPPPVGYKVTDQRYSPSDPAATENFLNQLGQQGNRLAVVYPDSLRGKTRWILTTGTAASPVPYKVVDLPWSPTEPAITETMLNQLGQAGWQLVIAYPDPRRERTRWIFSQGAGGSPGGAEATGWTLLSSGTLSNQGSFDVTVPAGPSTFQFRLVGAVMAVADWFSFMVSYDGSTFIGDSINYDTYSLACMALNHLTSDFSTRGPGLAGHESDWYAMNFAGWDRVADTFGPTVSFDYYMDFSPGDTSSYFKSVNKLLSKELYSTQGGKSGFEESMVMLNPYAVSPPAMDRVTMIRFGSYKFLTGDTNNFTSGKWFLLGL